MARSLSRHLSTFGEDDSGKDDPARTFQIVSNACNSAYVGENGTRYAQIQIYLAPPPRLSQDSPHSSRVP